MPQTEIARCYQLIDGKPCGGKCDVWNNGTKEYWIVCTEEHCGYEGRRYSTKQQAIDSHNAVVERMQANSVAEILAELTKGDQPYGLRLYKDIIEHVLKQAEAGELPKIGGKR